MAYWHDQPNPWWSNQAIVGVFRPDHTPVFGLAAVIGVDDKAFVDEKFSVLQLFFVFGKPLGTVVLTNLFIGCGEKYYVAV